MNRNLTFCTPHCEGLKTHLPKEEAWQSSIRFKNECYVMECDVHNGQSFSRSSNISDAKDIVRFVFLSTLFGNKVASFFLFSREI